MYEIQQQNKIIIIVLQTVAKMKFMNEIFLKLLDPPGPPEIVGYTEGETVRSGQDVRLECVSRGGNPLATVVWYRNEVKIDHTYETSGRESRNVYAFRAEPGDNIARFRCEASNALSVAPMKAEVTLTVHCKYLLTSYWSVLTIFIHSNT
jgi:hypothetical protein